MRGGRAKATQESPTSMLANTLTHIVGYMKLADIICTSSHMKTVLSHTLLLCHKSMLRRRQVRPLLGPGGTLLLILATSILLLHCHDHLVII